MSRPQRIELFLFITCFFAFAYFNQGGGWNQNARFAEVRAVVEEGRFAIDDFLVYKRNAAGDDLVRVPLDHAEYSSNGERFRLCWVDMEWTLYPMGDLPLGPGVKKAAMVSICASGDVGYVPKTGHFHPNKPPGTTLLAVPGYFLIYHVEKLLGLNPDHWWILDVNAWLTSVCSVGLISALGCVFFFRITREMVDGALLPALLATFAFAFGTTFFPFSTILFDHDLTASLFVATFYCLRRYGGRYGYWPAVCAGVCSGLAVLTNYPAVLGVAALGLYALLAGGFNWRRTLAFCAGGIPPAIVLGLYSWSCYGSILGLSNDFQSPLFKDEGAFLGMFTIPHTEEQLWRTFYVAKLLLFSPFRGVFWFCPVLLMSFIGLMAWIRQRRFADVALCLGGFMLFFVMNTLFNGYHAGFSAGPRYLIPGIAFLAFPLVSAFKRWPVITCGLAVVSIGINLLLTATDAQNPTGIGGHTRIEGRREDQTYDLISEYAWPLFWYGSAKPLLEQELVVEMEKNRQRIAAQTDDLVERAQLELSLQAVLRRGIERGEASPFLLASVKGPVSVNPLGVFEGLFEYDFFPPRSRQCRWASFNVGEFLWPESRWSLLPLVVISGGLAAAAIVLARREDRTGAGA